MLRVILCCMIPQVGVAYTLSPLQDHFYRYQINEDTELSIRNKLNQCIVYTEEQIVAYQELLYYYAVLQDKNKFQLEKQKCEQAYRQTKKTKNIENYFAYQMALAYYLLGVYDSSIIYMQRVESDGQDTRFQCSYNLLQGMTYAEMGQVEWANISLDKALELAATSNDYSFEVAMIYLYRAYLLYRQNLKAQYAVQLSMADKEIESYSHNLVDNYNYQVTKKNILSRLNLVKESLMMDKIIFKTITKLEFYNISSANSNLSTRSQTWLKKSAMRFIEGPMSNEKDAYQRLIWVFIIILSLLCSTVVTLIVMYHKAKRSNKMFSLYIDKLNDQNGLIIKALKQRDELLKEFQYRLFNSLHFVNEIIKLMLTYQTDSKLRQITHSMASKVNLIVTMYHEVYNNEGNYKVDIRTYLEQGFGELAEQYPEKHLSLVLECEDISIEIHKGIYMLVLAKEIVRNSYKYAFPYSSTGKIYIYFKQEQDNYIFIVGDNGVGISSGMDSEATYSYGTALIKLVTEKLGASYSRNSSNGLIYTFVFPKAIVPVQK